MRVLYSGGTSCSFSTLQRLVLLADEIAFMDRPSVMFGNMGTVGQASEFRRVITDGSPIDFSIHSPPSGPSKDLYLRYIEADLKNPEFIRTVLDGLKADETFRGRLIQPKANYGWGTGEQVLVELFKDVTLYEGEYGEISKPELLYVPDTDLGRRQTLCTMLVEASIHATNALIVAEETRLAPVSDDSYFCHLLALRCSNSPYISQKAAVSSILGLAIASSVLPDQAISKLNMKDLFEYRLASKDAYAAWSIELDRISNALLDVQPSEFATEMERIISTDVNPRLHDLRMEMKGARDRLFGDLIKSVTQWEVPTLSIAYVAGLSIPTAIAAFAGALTPAVPAVVDYFVDRRSIYRKNSLAYLVGLSPGSASER